MASKPRSAFSIYSECENNKEDKYSHKSLKTFSSNSSKQIQKANNIDMTFSKNSGNKNFQLHETKALVGVSKKDKKKKSFNKKLLKLERNSLLNNNELCNRKNFFDIKTCSSNLKNEHKGNNKLDDSKNEFEKNKIRKDKNKHINNNNKANGHSKETPFTTDSNSIDEIADNNEIFDSRDEALTLFQKIIYPIEAKVFFTEYWEKKPLHIKRKNINYYKNWFSCKEFHSILRNHTLEFTQNIDITTYVDGVKENHNPEGRAYAPLVWDFFQQGCSIRLLNPQTYSRNLWKYLSLIQELFCTSVGSNIYLTPAGTQGFAPHYDDIEAFAIQLEGKKRWRVYSPRNENETLPRFSSRNFNEKEIGEPIIDCILESGDLLYFPRGFIHQANACDDIHSLHITLSSYQKNTYGDFLSKLLPAAVEIAIAEDVEFRKGLPLNFIDNNGLVFDKDKKKQKDRKEFFNTITYLSEKLIRQYLPIGAASDQMAKRYIHDSLPPYLSNFEKMRSIHGNGEKWNEDKNRVDCAVEIQPETEIKLIRKNCLRLVMEEKACLVYHSVENSRIFQEKEEQYLEVESDALSAIEFLIRSYPNYVKVERLPMKNIDEKITVASCLYDKGLVITSEPLEAAFESDDSEEELSEVESNNVELNQSDDSNSAEKVSINNVTHTKSKIFQSKIDKIYENEESEDSNDSVDERTDDFDKSNHIYSSEED